MFSLSISYFGCKKFSHLIHHFLVFLFSVLSHVHVFLFLLPLLKELIHLFYFLHLLRNSYFQLFKYFLAQLVAEVFITFFKCCLLVLLTSSLLLLLISDSWVFRSQSNLYDSILSISFLMSLIPWLQSFYSNHSINEKEFVVS